MMKGNHQETEHILKVEPNPTYGDKRNLPYNQLKKVGREWFMAVWMVTAVKVGGCQRQIAEEDAAELFKVSKSAANKAYDKYKTRILAELETH